MKEHIDPWALLESMTESVLLTDTSLEHPGPYIIYVNPAFEKMTGWSPEEVIGKSPRILQGEKTDLSIFRELTNMLEGGTIWQGQTINYKKDGSEFVMQWSIVPIRNKKGEIHQYLAVQKDVSEKVKLEQKLERSRKREQKRYEQLEVSNKRINEVNEELSSTLDLFYKYVPEQVIKKALEGHRHSVFEGEELDAALLFCDIRNFTAICEGLTPADVVFLLNTFYETMSQIIKSYNGTINQFVGDEIFVSFGTPIFLKDPEENSVRCALKMIEAVDSINRQVKDRIDSEITVGIGINYGPIIAGNLGGEERISYSITGDTVNTAKRIESLAKEKPNTILVSESVYKITKHLFETESWGPQVVRGKYFKLEVYEIKSLI
jgi:PAS domain S-box-containing protein